MTTLLIELPFRGDAVKAVEFIASALTVSGFRIVGRSDVALSVTGPRWTARNVRSQPLGGVASMEIRAGNGALTAQADIRNINRVFYIGIAALALWLIPVNIYVSKLFELTRISRSRLWLLDGSLVLALLLLPSARNVARSRIRSGLQTLLHNAAAMATR